MSYRRRRRTTGADAGRYLAFLTVAFGILALGLSLVLSDSKAPPRAALAANEPAYSQESVRNPASRPTRATASEANRSTPAATQPRAPITRDAAPVEARPAGQARSLGGSTSRSASSGSSATTPFSVVIAIDGRVELDALAAEITGRLTETGIEAETAWLDEAGRSDAVVVLGTAANAAAEAWYCDHGPAIGRTLAGFLLDAAADLGSMTPNASPSDGPKTPFPCAGAQAGRSSTAMVLLEIPALLAEGGTAGDDAAAAITAAISRYFTANAGAIRRARTARRLIWPATGPITSRFGPSHPLGIDIGQWYGSVVAATDGTVTWAGGDPCCEYGRYVIIESDDGIRTLYAHLDSLRVRQDQRVRQGQALGKVGCSGHCSGPHLHFEVFDRGKRQDPMRYLP